MKNKYDNLIFVPCSPKKYTIKYYLEGLHQIGTYISLSFIIGMYIEGIRGILTTSKAMLFGNPLLYELKEPTNDS